MRITNAFGSNFSTVIAQEGSMQLQWSMGLDLGEQTAEVNDIVIALSETLTFLIFLKTELENSVLHFTYVIIFLNLQRFDA